MTRRALTWGFRFGFKQFRNFTFILPEYMGQSGLGKGSLTMWKAYELSSILDENVDTRQNLIRISINLSI